MSYGEARGQTHEEQAHLHSKFYGMAYDLLRKGVRYEAVIEWPIEQGVEHKLARKISTSAAESYQSARSETIQKLLQRGFLSLVGGLGFTALSYAAAGAGESYLIATGAIGWSPPDHHGSIAARYPVNSAGR